MSKTPTQHEIAVNTPAIWRTRRWTTLAIFFSAFIILLYLYFFITTAKIKALDIIDEGKERIKEVKSKTNSIVPNIKDDNELQINIMEKAGIPEKEIPKYALSSVADGRILRDYVNEVKSGEITKEEAVIKVKKDYDKMKTGKKDGKFVSPFKNRTKR